jgi:hypothetical protein
MDAGFEQDSKKTPKFAEFKPNLTEFERFSTKNTDILKESMIEKRPCMVKK